MFIKLGLFFRILLIGYEDEQAALSTQLQRGININTLPLAASTFSLE
jgi:hypothetical protein